MNRKSTRDRRAEIADAAMRIIARKGVKKFTAKLVADEVGITPGAIFRHYNKMEDIVDAVIDRMEEILFEDFPPRAAAPLARLEEFFRKRIDAVARNADLSKLLLSDVVADLGGDAPTTRVLEFKQRSRRFVRRCLQEARDEGTIPASVGVEAAAAVILGAIMMAAHSSAGRKGKTAAAKFSQDVWDLLLDMVKAKKTTMSHEKGNPK